MYQAVFSDEFISQLKKIKKKDPQFFDRLEKKIRSLLTDPSNIKHLRNVLKGKQRIHLGSFVLVIEVEEETINFITIKHHDDAY